MRLRTTAWVGIATISAGLILFSGKLLWSKTRTWVPVNLAIPLSVGSLPPIQFTTNLRALYLIDIEVERKLPFERLNCLLGVDTNEKRLASCPEAPVIGASWVLSNHGVIVASSSTAENKGGVWAADTIARQIGSFMSEKQNYTLVVQILANGSVLASCSPRLKVEVHPQSYEDDAFVDLEVLILSAIAVVSGAIMLVLSARRERRRIRQSP
jgi:hypothetical protein